ncbi:MAG: MFS transporter, partial [Spirochaetia bacterium]|nr:MFS transporter [Spirochaetia bacterium]
MISKFLSFSPSKDYYSIFFGWILSATGFGVLLPFISIYFTDKFSLSITDIGYFFLMSSILRALFQAFGGELSDTLGRKNIILFALFGRAFFLLLLAFFDLFFVNLFYILIFLGLTYMFSAIFMPVTQAAIADLVPENKYLEAYSIIRIGGNLGWIFGPILGGLVYEYSKSFYFLFSAIFSIFGGLIFLFSFSNS